MRITTLTIATMLITQFVQAQDLLVFTSGKQYQCEVVSYENGQFTVRLQDGSVKQAPAASVKSIVFMAHPQQQPPDVTAPGTNPVPPTALKDASFRNTKWGMTRTEVKATESKPPTSEADNALIYSDSLAGLDAFVVYIFAADRLVRAKYTLIEDHTNKNDYINDYDSLKTSLAVKYGEPQEHDTIWKRDLYKSDHDEWGFAVSHGDLVYTEKWETQETTIFHALYGDNFKITHVVEYTSKLLKSLEDSEKKKTDEGKL
jgi:hypothetical protein